MSDGGELTEAENEPVAQSFKQQYSQEPETPSASTINPAEIKLPASPTTLSDAEDLTNTEPVVEQAKQIVEPLSPAATAADRNGELVDKQNKPFIGQQSGIPLFRPEAAQEPGHLELLAVPTSTGTERASEANLDLPAMPLSLASSPLPTCSSRSSMSASEPSEELPLDIPPLPSTTSPNLIPTAAAIVATTATTTAAPNNTATPLAATTTPAAVVIAAVLHATDTADEATTTEATTIDEHAPSQRAAARSPSPPSSLRMTEPEEDSPAPQSHTVTAVPRLPEEVELPASPVSETQHEYSSLGHQLTTQDIDANAKQLAHEAEQHHVDTSSVKGDEHDQHEQHPISEVNPTEIQLPHSPKATPDSPEQQVELVASSPEAESTLIINDEISSSHEELPSHDELHQSPKVAADAQDIPELPTLMAGSDSMDTPSSPETKAHDQELPSSPSNIEQLEQLPVITDLLQGADGTWSAAPVFLPQVDVDELPTVVTERQASPSPAVEEPSDAELPPTATTIELSDVEERALTPLPTQQKSLADELGDLSDSYNSHEVSRSVSPAVEGQHAEVQSFTEHANDSSEVLQASPAQKTLADELGELSDSREPSRSQSPAADTERAESPSFDELAKDAELSHANNEMTVAAEDVELPTSSASERAPSPSFKPQTNNQDNDIPVTAESHETANVTILRSLSPELPENIELPPSPKLPELLPSPNIVPGYQFSPEPVSDDEGLPLSAQDDFEDDNGSPVDVEQYERSFSDDSHDLGSSPEGTVEYGEDRDSTEVSPEAERRVEHIERVHSPTFETETREMDVEPVELAKDIESERSLPPVEAVDVTEMQHELPSQSLPSYIQSADGAWGDVPEEFELPASPIDGAAESQSSPQFPTSSPSPKSTPEDAVLSPASEKTMDFTPSSPFEERSIPSSTKDTFEERAVSPAPEEESASSPAVTFADVELPATTEQDINSENIELRSSDKSIPRDAVLSPAPEVETAEFAPSVESPKVLPSEAEADAGLPKSLLPEAEHEEVDLPTIAAAAHLPEDVELPMSPVDNDTKGERIEAPSHIELPQDNHEAQTSEAMPPKISPEEVELPMSPSNEVEVQHVEFPAGTPAVEVQHVEFPTPAHEVTRELGDDQSDHIHDEVSTSPKIDEPAEDDQVQPSEIDVDELQHLHSRQIIPPGLQRGAFPVEVPEEFEATTSPIDEEVTPEIIEVPRSPSPVDVDEAQHLHSRQIIPPVFQRAASPDTAPQEIELPLYMQRADGTWGEAFDVTDELSASHMEDTVSEEVEIPASPNVPEQVEAPASPVSETAAKEVELSRSPLPVDVDEAQHLHSRQIIPPNLQRSVSPAAIAEDEQAQPEQAELPSSPVVEAAPEIIETQRSSSPIDVDEAQHLHSMQIILPGLQHQARTVSEEEADEIPLYIQRADGTWGEVVADEQVELPTSSPEDEPVIDEEASEVTSPSVAAAEQADEVEKVEKVDTSRSPSPLPVEKELDIDEMQHQHSSQIIPPHLERSISLAPEVVSEETDLPVPHFVPEEVEVSRSPSPVLYVQRADGTWGEVVSDEEDTTPVEELDIEEVQHQHSAQIIPTGLEERSVSPVEVDVDEAQHLHSRQIIPPNLQRSVSPPVPEEVDETMPEEVELPRAPSPIVELEVPLYVQRADGTWGEIIFEDAEEVPTLPTEDAIAEEVQMPASPTVVPEQLELPSSTSSSLEIVPEEIEVSRSPLPVEELDVTEMQHQHSTQILPSQLQRSVSPAPEAASEEAGVPASPVEEITPKEGEPAHSPSPTTELEVPLYIQRADGTWGEVIPEEPELAALTASSPKSVPEEVEESLDDRRSPSPADGLDVFEMQHQHSGQILPSQLERSVSPSLDEVAPEETNVEELARSSSPVAEMDAPLYVQRADGTWGEIVEEDAQISASVSSSPKMAPEEEVEDIEEIPRSTPSSPAPVRELDISVVQHQHSSQILPSQLQRSVSPTDEERAVPEDIELPGSPLEEKFTPEEPEFSRSSLPVEKEFNVVEMQHELPAQTLPLYVQRADGTWGELSEPASPIIAPEEPKEVEVSRSPSPVEKELDVEEMQHQHSAQILPLFAPFFVQRMDGTWGDVDEDSELPRAPSPTEEVKTFEPSSSVAEELEDEQLDKHIAPEDSPVIAAKDVTLQHEPEAISLPVDQDLDLLPALPETAPASPVEEHSSLATSPFIRPVIEKEPVPEAVSEDVRGLTPEPESVALPVDQDLDLLPELPESGPASPTKEHSSPASSPVLESAIEKELPHPKDQDLLSPQESEPEIIEEPARQSFDSDLYYDAVEGKGKQPATGDEELTKQGDASKTSPTQEYEVVDDVDDVDDLDSIDGVESDISENGLLTEAPTSKQANQDELPKRDRGEEEVAAATIERSEDDAPIILPRDPTTTTTGDGHHADILSREADNNVDLRRSAGGSPVPTSTSLAAATAAAAGATLIATAVNELLAKTKKDDELEPSDTVEVHPAVKGVINRGFDEYDYATVVSPTTVGLGLIEDVPQELYPMDGPSPKLLSVSTFPLEEAGNDEGDYFANVQLPKGALFEELPSDCEQPVPEHASHFTHDAPSEPEEHEVKKPRKSVDEIQGPETLFAPRKPMPYASTRATPVKESPKPAPPAEETRQPPKQAEPVRHKRIKSTEPARLHNEALTASLSPPAKTPTRNSGPAAVSTGKAKALAASFLESSSVNRGSSPVTPRFPPSAMHQQEPPTSVLLKEQSQRRSRELAANYLETFADDRKTRSKSQSRGTQTSTSFLGRAAPDAASTKWVPVPVDLDSLGQTVVPEAEPEPEQPEKPEKQEAASPPSVSSAEEQAEGDQSMALELAVSYLDDEGEDVGNVPMVVTHGASMEITPSPESSPDLPPDNTREVMHGPEVAQVPEPEPHSQQDEEENNDSPIEWGRGMSLPSVEIHPATPRVVDEEEEIESFFDIPPAPATPVHHDIGTLSTVMEESEPTSADEAEQPTPKPAHVPTFEAHEAPDMDRSEDLERSFSPEVQEEAQPSPSVEMDGEEMQRFHSRQIIPPHLQRSPSPQVKPEEVELPSSPIIAPQEVELPSSPVLAESEEPQHTPANIDIDELQHLHSRQIIPPNLQRSASTSSYVKPEEVDLPSSPVLKPEDVELPTSPVEEDINVDELQQFHSRQIIPPQLQRQAPSPPAVKAEVELPSSPVEEKMIPVVAATGLGVATGLALASSKAAKKDKYHFEDDSDSEPASSPVEERERHLGDNIEHVRRPATPEIGPADVQRHASPEIQVKDIGLPNSPKIAAEEVGLPSSPVNEREDLELTSGSDSDEEDNLPIVEDHSPKPEDIDIAELQHLHSRQIIPPHLQRSASPQVQSEEVENMPSVKAHSPHPEEIGLPLSPAIEPRDIELPSTPVNEHEGLEFSSDSDSEADDHMMPAVKAHFTKPEEIGLPSSPAIPSSPMVQPRDVELPSTPKHEHDYSFEFEPHSSPEQQRSAYPLHNVEEYNHPQRDDDEDDYDPLADLLPSPEASPEQHRERYQRELPGHPHPLMMHPVEYSAPYHHDYDEKESVHTPVHVEPVEFWHSPELRYHPSPELRPAEQEFGVFPEVQPEDVQLPPSPADEEQGELPHVKVEAGEEKRAVEVPDDEWESDHESGEEFEHDDENDDEFEVHQAETVAIATGTVAMLGGAALVANTLKKKEEDKTGERDVQRHVESEEKAEESESDEENEKTEDEDEQVKPVAITRGDDKQDSEDGDSEFEGRQRGGESEDEHEGEADDKHGEEEAKGTPKAVPEGGEGQRAEDDVLSVSIMNDADTKSLASKPSSDGLVEPGLDRQDSETIPKAIREGAPMPWALQSKRREDSNSPPPVVQRSFSFPDDIADEEAFIVSRSNTVNEGGGDTKHGEGPAAAATSHATSEQTHTSQHQQTPSAPMSTISDYAHSYNSLPTMQEEQDWTTDDDKKRDGKDGNITGLFRYGTPIMDPNRDSGFTLSARGSPQMPRYAVFNEQYHQQQQERYPMIKEEDLRERGVNLRDFANSPSAGSDRTETGPSSPLRTAATPTIQEPVPESPENKMDVGTEPQHGETAKQETSDDKPEQHIPKTLPGLGIAMRSTGATRSVADISKQLQSAVSGNQSPSPTPRPIPSNTGVARLRSPEPLSVDKFNNLRPDSPGSSISSRSHTSTPPLRRMDKRATGNLRSLSFGSQQDSSAKSFLGTLAEEGEGETQAQTQTATAAVSSPPPASSRSLKAGPGSVSPTGTPSRGVNSDTTTSRSGSSLTAEHPHPSQVPATPSPPRPNTSRAASANSVLAGAGATALALGTTHLLSTPAVTTTPSPVAGDDNLDKSKDKHKQAVGVVVTTPRALSVASATPVANEGRTRSKGSMDVPDVYDGLGEGRLGSPRSPARPPSLRKRQSVQLNDLENKLAQLMAENAALTKAKNDAEAELSHRNAELASILADKEVELENLERDLREAQEEYNRLEETYEGLRSSSSAIAVKHSEKVRELEEQVKKATEELAAAQRGGHEQYTKAIAEKDAQIAHLRAQLDAQTAQIREMQETIENQQQALAEAAARQQESSEPSVSDDFLDLHDVDYFDQRLQQLCAHVQQWVLRFSKFSDMRRCRPISEIDDAKLIDRLDNAVLDGSDVDDYLADRVRRRDVFMSMVMTMIYEFVFTRFLFGMDRDQRQRLKYLEKQMSETGPVHAVRQWRAVTLTLLSQRRNYKSQRDRDTEAVVQAILDALDKILPPPSDKEKVILDQLRRVVREAVSLSIHMRCQRAEYIMLPPLQPEYDESGELVETVSFNAALMNERSGDADAPDPEELERQRATVRVVLFPLVIRKGDDMGRGDDEVVVCPAQVLVQRPRKQRRVVSGGGRPAVSRAPTGMGGMEGDEVMGGMETGRI